jgi:hypothetical protein
MDGEATDMTRRFMRRAVMVCFGLVLAAGGIAGAQQLPAGLPGTYQGQQSMATAAYQAATVSPSTPFLSPYLMTMGQANPDYMTYLYLQNQKNGGIGSGVISGTRVAPGVPAGSTPAGSAPPAKPASATYAAPGLGKTRSAFPDRPPVALNRVALPMNANGTAQNAGASFMRGPRTNHDAARYFNRTTPDRNSGR